MDRILPGIGSLEKNWDEIEEKILQVKSFAKSIHIDVVDGKFAENLTFLDPEPFKKYSKDIFFEVHLMVEEPINYLEPFAEAGFKRFIGQIEKMESQEAFVAKAQNLGEVGLSIDGPTPLSDLKVDLMDLDMLLIMTIKAGIAGQKFTPEHLEKVREISQRIDRLQLNPLAIEVDGGINDRTIQEAKAAGASYFISTSYIFKEDPKKNYKNLVNLIS